MSSTKLGENLDAVVIRQINVMRFAKMEISRRARTGLLNAGLECFGDLNWAQKQATQIRSQLLRTPGMGDKSAREVVELLHRLIGRQEPVPMLMVEVPAEISAFVKNNISLLVGIKRGELEVIRKIAVHGMDKNTSVSSRAAMQGERDAA